jgi:hypothetical protein
VRAEIEKEFMNEIVSLQIQLNEEKKNHLDAIGDWERMHRNEMLERDFTIAQLTEEIRKLKMKVGQQDATPFSSTRPKTRERHRFQSESNQGSSSPWTNKGLDDIANTTGAMKKNNLGLKAILQRVKLAS